MKITKSRRVVIRTKFLPVTATKGDRVKATAVDRPGKSVTVSWYAENLPKEDAHDTAAREYCEMMAGLPIGQAGQFLSTRLRSDKFSFFREIF